MIGAWQVSFRSTPVLPIITCQYKDRIELGERILVLEISSLTRLYRARIDLVERKTHGAVFLPNLPLAKIHYRANLGNIYTH